MATRRAYIEKILRLIYNGQPSEDSNITINLVNAWLPDALGIAAKQCYVESIKMDGVAYVNNSFSTTFSGITITADNTNNLGYKISLPQIPLGLGKNEGINTLRFKDETGFISQSVIWLSTNQIGYADAMRPIPNKIKAYNEGSVVRLTSTLPLYLYTATVSMVSGGDSTNLDSEINAPDDYLPVITEYIKAQLLLEKAQVPDQSNDGQDNKG
jgi:hypothetical protein